MNIWLINHYAVPPQYYPLARTACFAKYLIRMGHEVTIFAASMVHNSQVNLIEDRSAYREDMADGIRYVYVRTGPYNGNGMSRIWNMLEFSRRLPRVCAHFQKPDAILASSATPPACMSGLKLGKKYGCRAVAEISDLWPESFVAYGLIGQNSPLLPPLYRYEKRIYAKADAIIFTMEGGRDYLIEKKWDQAGGGPVDLGKVYHINNGIDLEAFDRNRDLFRFPDPDLDDSSVFKAVYVGSIRRVNRLGDLVAAAGVLQKDPRAQNIRILVYGDGDELASLKDEAQALGNIVFKGRVDKKYVPYILSKADLCVMQVQSNPIMKYGMSMNKTFEYLASGKPVLVNFHANHCVVDKYHCGLSKELRTPEEYARAILDFALMPAEEYGAMCENAKLAADDYDFAELTRRLMDILGPQESTPFTDSRSVR